MKNSTLTCPECGGMISISDDGLEYACKIGHRYSAGGFLVNQNSNIESAFWTAYRLLNDRYYFLKRISDQKKSEPRVSSLYGQHADNALKIAESLRGIIEKELEEFAEEELPENTI